MRRLFLFIKVTITAWMYFIVYSFEMYWQSPIGSRQLPIVNWSSMAMYFIYLLLYEPDPFGLYDLMDDFLFADPITWSFRSSIGLLYLMRDRGWYYRAGLFCVLHLMQRCIQFGG